MRNAILEPLTTSICEVPLARNAALTSWVRSSIDPMVIPRSVPVTSLGKYLSKATIQKSFTWCMMPVSPHGSLKNVVRNIYPNHPWKYAYLSYPRRGKVMFFLMSPLKRIRSHTSRVRFEGISMKREKRASPHKVWEWCISLSPFGVSIVSKVSMDTWYTLDRSFA